MANQTGGSVTWNLDAVDNTFGKQLVKSEAEAQAFGKSVNGIQFEKIFSNATTAFGGIANAISGAFIKVGLVSAVTGGIFLKSAADLQQTSKSFEVLTGNVDVANKLFAQLARYANSTPFEFPDIAKAGQTLLGFGIQAKDVFDRVRLLGDIAAATGADFGSLALVFGQVNATGKLMGQDALQLINNKIPVFNILAKEMGIKVADVKAKMEDGAISADLFNTALLHATQQGGFAFKGVDVLAQSVNGRLSTMKDAVLDFGRNLLGVKIDPELGLVIKPGGLFDKFSNALPAITAGLQKIQPAIVGAFSFLIDHGSTIVALLGAIAAAWLAAKVASVAFGIATALSNPFTAIALGITLVIGLLTFLQIKFDIFGKSADFLSQKLAFLKPFLENLQTAFGNISAVLETQLNPMLGFLQQHWDVISKILLVLIGAVLAPLIVSFVGIASAVLLAYGAVTAIITIFRGLIMIVWDVGSAIVNAFGVAIKWFTGLPSLIQHLIGDLSMVLFSPGQALVHGLLDGIGSILPKLAGFMVDKLPKAIQGPFKKALGIASPSKVFAGYGKNIVQGLVNGIGQAESMVGGAMGSLANNMTVNGDLGTPVMASSGYQGGNATPTATGGTTIVQNNTVNTQVDMDKVTRDLAWRVRR